MEEKERNVGKTSSTFEQKYWSREWFKIIPENAVLIRRSLFGTIRAVVVDIPKKNTGLIKRNDKFNNVSEFEIRENFEDKEELITEIDDKKLDKLIKYYQITSRTNYLKIALAEKEYRNFLKKIKIPESKYKSAIRKRFKISEMPTEISALVGRPETSLYYREYSNEIMDIKKTKAKIRLRIRFPFEHIMVISTEKRQINTITVELRQNRAVSFDINPWFTVVDPKTYVEKLQTEEHRLDESKLKEKIGERINDIFRRYISSRGEDKINDLDRAVRMDTDLKWDLTKLGMEYGIQFEIIPVKNNTREVVEQANKNAAKLAELETRAQVIKSLTDLGIDPNLAAMSDGGFVGMGDGKGIDPSALIYASMFRNGVFGGQSGQQTPLQNTKSGLTIEQLAACGLCDEFGTMSDDNINFVLAIRGEAPGSSLVLAPDLSRDEVNQLYKKIKTKRR